MNKLLKVLAVVFVMGKQATALQVIRMIDAYLLPKLRPVIVSMTSCNLTTLPDPKPVPVFKFSAL